MRTRAVFLATLVALSGGTAAAQEPSLKNLQVATPTAESLRNAESVLMRWSAPVLVIVKGGETYRQVVARHCPGVSDDYMEALHAALPLLNADLPDTINLDDDAAPSAPLSIPFCVGSEFDRYVVKPGENAWELFEAQKSLTGGFSTWQTFQKRFEEVNGTTHLQPGEQVFLPKASLNLPVWSDTVQQVGRELEFEAGIKDFRDTGPVNWGVIQTEPIADPCESGSAALSATWSQDHFHGFADALEINRRLDAIHRWDRALLPQYVAVMDTGLDGIEEWERSGMASPLGRLVQTADILVDPKDTRKFHGSGVRSTVLGGHLLTWIHPTFGMVRDAPFRITQSRTPPARPGSGGSASTLPPQPAVADGTRLRDGLAMVRDSTERIAVVNISAAFPHPITDFTEHVSPKARSLIVIAAGNEGKDLDSASNPYPARHGGDEASNVISVAATDHGGALLATSNRSTLFVDIAALGCRIPVLEYDDQSQTFSLKHRSGTSYAAPQVSFVAAMLAAEVKRNAGGILPVDMKRRLLYAADIRPHLWSAVRHGRHLNVRKALSVYADLIELSDGSLLRGQILFNVSEDGDIGPGADFALCADVSTGRRDLRKIAYLDPVPDEAGAKRYLVYSEDDSGQRLTRTRWCDTISARITLEDPFTRTRRKIDISKVKDIVFASQPYWQ